MMINNVKQQEGEVFAMVEITAPLICLGCKMFLTIPQ